MSNIFKKIDAAIHHGDGEHINRDMFSVTLLKKKTHDEFHTKFGKNSYQKSKSIVKNLNEKREKSKKKQLDKKNTERFDKLTSYITFVESYSNIEDPKTKLITMYNNYASAFNCKNSLDVFIEAINTEYPEF
jgi:glutamine synthetase adenylyltransferase